MATKAKAGKAKAKAGKSIQAPTDPDELDEFFADAVYKIDRARIEAALDAGAKFEPKDGSESVLMFNCNFDNALKPKDIERIELLLELGADPLYRAKADGNRCVLHELSFEPNLFVLELLVKASKGKLKAYADEMGNTPLHYATWYGKDEKYFERLLALGNPVDSANENGERPIHSAMERDNARAATFLVKHGASLDGLAEFIADPKNQCSPKAKVLLDKLGKLAAK